MNKENQAPSNDKIMMVASQVKCRLDMINGEIEKYQKEMNTDYEYFYQWYSEDMYRLHVSKKYYQELTSIIEEDGTHAMESYLRNKVHSMKSELLFDDLRKCGTSSSMNLAYMEAKQKVMLNFTHLLCLLE